MLGASEGREETRKNGVAAAAAERCLLGVGVGWKGGGQKRGLWRRQEVN